MKKNEPVKESTVVKAPLDDLISERYGDYAKYIIQDRALPDARDGLKPVQRRILYAMNKDGNTSDKAFRKSAKTVGNVIGNYHPHGDSSVYEAMVRLSQQWKINHPLVTMHGNNGSIDDDPPAAMRYTEARLAPISETMLEDIDKDTVSWAPNFDDSENEPTVLPAMFPNLLVNGATGIAAGYATNIPPHNLKEIIDGTVYRVNHPNCTLDEMMQIVRGPDFPTGGIVQGIEGIREAFTSGKGRIVVRGRAAIEKNKTNQQIIITEIPYEVIKVNMVKKIDEIRFNKDIDGILDVRDESDRNGLRVVVDIKNEVDAQNILNYLYKNTDLQVYYNYNMVSIVNQRPMLLGLLESLDAYIGFRKEVIIARSHYEFNKRIERCHILEGLIKAVSILDEIIKIIRHSKDKGDAKRRLMDKYEFTEPQAEAIVTLRLYRLTNTDVFQLKEEFARLVQELKELKEIIENEKKLNEVMCRELEGIADKFGKDRLTDIEHQISDLTIEKKAMIANEHVVITLSHDGYIKRVSMRSYNASPNTITGLKEDDQLVGWCECDTVDTLLAFAESGEYVSIPVYQINEAKWKDIGQHISSIVKINNSEKFVSGVMVKDFNSYCWIVHASAGGMIKRSLLPQWQLQRNSRSSLAMKLDDGDRIIAASLAYQNDDVALVTNDGYALRYALEEIPETGVRAKGVKAVKLTEKDQLGAMAIISGQSEMVYLTEKGGSKRLKINDLDVTRRATKGILIAKKNKTNPHKITISLALGLNDSLNLISDEGLVETKAKDIALMNKEARFSNSLTLKNWYHINGIEEARIVDIPQDKPVKSFEEIQLEV
ncbi:MAG: DNA topoisomerase IV subunit A [Erysipelotrichaceae bacterium]|nr:DNA topoisomerase IV subunit A [Erysipelotrichaceae bacterium]